MYIGGSPMSSLKYMNGANIGIVHVDDFPEDVSGAVLNDRVFPGEGILPTHELAGLLHQIGYGGYLSLELFIEDYRGENALEVARRGLDSIKQAYSV
jgi:2-keto-myo-inositol isomerase